MACGAGLPADHPLVGVRADELAYSANAFDNFERYLLQTAEQEAKQPSYANLPLLASCCCASALTMIPASVRRCFSARRDCMKSLGRPGMKVERILNPATGDVLWGGPFDRAR